MAVAQVPLLLHLLLHSTLCGCGFGERNIRVHEYMALLSAPCSYTYSCTSISGSHHPAACCAAG